MGGANTHTLRLIVEAVDRADATLRNVGARVNQVDQQVRKSTEGMGRVTQALASQFQGLGATLGATAGTFQGSMDPLRLTLDSVGQSVSGVQQKVAGMGGLFGALAAAVPVVAALAAAGGFLAKSLADASQETQNFIQLEATWKALNRGGAEDMQKLIDATKDLSRTSSYASQDVIGGMKLLAGFRNIATEDLLPTMRVVIDMAAYMGVGIQQAAYIMSYAARGEMQMLREWGFTFTEATQKSRNFADILREMGERVSGQEAAKMQTYAGAVGMLSKSFNRLEKAIGHVLEVAAVPVIKDLASFFSEISKGVEEAFKGGATEEWSNKVRAAFERTAGFVKGAVQGIISFAQSGGLERVFDVFVRLAGAMQDLISWIGSLIAKAMELPAWIWKAIAGFLMFRIVGGLFGPVIGGLGGILGRLGQLPGATKSWLDIIIPGVSTLPGLFTGAASSIGAFAAASGPILAIGAAIASWVTVIGEVIYYGEELTNWLKEDLGIVYDIGAAILKWGTGIGLLVTALKWLWEKLLGGGEKPSEGPTEEMVKGYKDRLEAAMMTGKGVAAEEGKIRAEVQATAGMTAQAKKRELEAVTRAGRELLKERMAAQKALTAIDKPVAGKTGGTEAEPEYKDRLERLKAYYNELEALQATQHEHERTRIWQTAESSEQAQRRVKEFSIRASLERVAILEQEFAATRAMQDKELEERLAKVKETQPDAEEARRKVRQEFAKEELKTTQEYQQKIQKAIQESEKGLQQLYKERLELLNQQAEASREAADALDQLASKSRTEYENLNAKIAHATESSRLAWELMATQPDKAIQAAKAARSEWVQLGQDVKALEKQLKDSERWYANWFRGIRKEGMTREQKWHSDMVEVLNLKRDAQTAAASGDAETAKARINEARQLIAEMYKESPNQTFQAYAINLMGDLRKFEQTLMGGLIQRAREMNERATQAIEDLNALIQKVWAAKVDENTQALKANTEAVLKAAGLQPGKQEKPKEVGEGTVPGTETTTEAGGGRELPGALRAVGDAVQRMGEVVKEGARQIGQKLGVVPAEGSRESMFEFYHRKGKEARRAEKDYYDRAEMSKASGGMPDERGQWVSTAEWLDRARRKGNEAKKWERKSDVELEAERRAKERNAADMERWRQEARDETRREAAEKARLKATDPGAPQWIRDLEAEYFNEMSGRTLLNDDTIRDMEMATAPFTGAADRGSTIDESGLQGMVQTLLQGFVGAVNTFADAARQGMKLDVDIHVNRDGTLTVSSRGNRDMFSTIG